jgi:hypothetical protein
VSLRRPVSTSVGVVGASMRGDVVLGHDFS